jgi:iron(II)-dependent oxidoreductase
VTAPISTTKLIAMLQNARARTYELVDDLDAEQLMGPKLGTINPLRWEIGHVAYFYEYFILRQLYGRESILGNQQADSLYDSIAVAHDTRWDLPLLSMAKTKDYMQAVLDSLCERLEGPMTNEQDSFIYQFGVFHEDMHTEAFIWGRQTLAYPMPNFANAIDASVERNTGAYPGYVEVPGGRFNLGADPDAPFLFDNEKYAHEVEIQPFSIAKAAVTNAEFAEFIAAGGYKNDSCWSPEGLKWRQQNQATHPGYWLPDGKDKWLMRRFDQTIPLPACEPVIHVTWYEADAYCRWAGLRLPTEIEWEVAALGEPDPAGDLSPNKRRYPWGESPPDADHANLDGRALGCVDVAAYANGDSAFGCRQMLGNVWEWTSDTFQPYPGFSADAYHEYSSMLFGSTKVLRGGAWTSRGRMLHGTYRNFFEPDRWNIFSGFRTCQL